MRGVRKPSQSICALKDISIWDQSLPAGQAILPIVLNMPRLGVCTHIPPLVPTPQGRHVLKTCLQKSVLVIERFIWRKTVPCHDKDSAIHKL